MAAVLRHTPDMSDALLQVRDLSVGFTTDEGLMRAVDGISFEVPRGKTVGLVGESGCGKSVTSFSISRLLPQPSGQILGGSIRFDGKNLVDLPLPEMAKLRGNEISMIFQEPMAALNPVQTIGRQMGEIYKLHRVCSAVEATRRSVEMLQKVGIPSPEIRLGEHPHQLSGGMRQRVMIAMALALKPRLLIADEPTTALDVTVQAQILDLMRELQAEMGMGILLITHDLGVIAETCDEVVVMYAGRVVERAPVGELFAAPRHAYTKGLLRSIPLLEGTPKTRLKTIEGNVPSLAEMPVGCRFCLRNGAPADSPTLRERPAFAEVSPGHWLELCPRCAA
jgi:peptide/nickel transport system ATP-binding protein